MGKKDQLKIATFNIRTDVQEDSETNEKDLWVNRFAYIKKMIEEGDWDIIGFQEPRESQLKDLSSLTAYDFVGNKRSDEVTAEYNPIFYKKDKFTLLNHSTKWLSETPDVLSKTDSWKASLPRIVTIAHLKSKETNQDFYFLNTHFDHISEEARYQSAQLVSKIIDDLDSTVPIFLTGDFNGERDDRWYQIISQKLKDTVKYSPHHVGPDGTRTESLFVDHTPKWQDMITIDYIFSNEHVSVEKTNVLTDKFNSRYPSDHFPISLTCTL